MQLPTFFAPLKTLAPSTWFVLGMSLQCLLAVLVPLRLAVLFTVLVLATYLLVISQRFPQKQALPAPFQENVHRGRWTAQLPSSDGSTPQKGSERKVVMFLTGASSSQYVVSTPRPSDSIPKYLSANGGNAALLDYRRLVLTSSPSILKECGRMPKPTVRNGDVRQISVWSFILAPSCPLEPNDLAKYADLSFLGIKI